MRLRRKYCIYFLGDPAGIGPALLYQGFKRYNLSFIVPGDFKKLSLLFKYYGQQKLPLKHYEEFQEDGEKAVYIYPVNYKDITPGIPNIEQRQAILHSLEKSAQLALKHRAILITGPVNKAYLSIDGHPFYGQTDYLEKTVNQNASMFFYADNMSLVLATRHLPIAKISQAITPAIFAQSLQHIIDFKKRSRQIHRIIIAGINPHCSDNGLIGHHEINFLNAAIKQAQEKNPEILGPYPADTLMRHVQAKDCILSWYHDQMLPVFKYIHPTCSANMSIGLPFLRIATNHGPCYDKINNFSSKNFDYIIKLVSTTFRDVC